MSQTYKLTNMKLLLAESEHVNVGASLFVCFFLFVCFVCFFVNYACVEAFECAYIDMCKVFKR